MDWGLPNYNLSSVCEGESQGENPIGKVLVFNNSDIYGSHTHYVKTFMSLCNLACKNQVQWANWADLHTVVYYSAQPK